MSTYTIIKRSGEKVTLDSDHIQSMINKGMTQTAIAEHYNISMSTLNSNINRFNIQGLPNKSSISKSISLSELRELNKIYTLKEIAKKFNCNVATISKLLHTGRQISMRGRSHESRVSKKTEINRVVNAFAKKFQISNTIIETVLIKELELLGKKGVLRRYDVYNK